MAETWEWKGYSLTTSGWDLTISGTGNRVGFCGSSFGSSVGVSEFQDSTWVTNDTMTVNYGQINNNKYESSTEVNTNSSGVKTLISGAVPLNECTLRISFTEDGGPTQTSASRFYAYDGTTPANGPTGVNTVAFEVDTASGGGDPLNINKTSDAGAGLAWNSSNGINGSSNKLQLADESAESAHIWYIGLSASPQTVGLKTAFTLRVETDYQ